ncbi:hypothetical protein JTE90_012349 [Oedothorax gibbosus]|uniref:KIF-binding protein n=1 Tax=Oedothorax gibbosus TaxID=931172 RepID=A0AAV6V577_9ARAC|nr:hypothetical protein JTE90_012349 [Oedothorax gibbosus]
MFVSEFSVWVSSARERYLSAKKLLEAAVDDPPSEPYKSKYAAGAIFSDIKAQLENQWRSNAILQVNLVSALLNYELGMIAVETEEKTAGGHLLETCLEEIKDVKQKPECCVLALSTLNQLGVLWSERGETEKALSFLLESETLYTEYKNSNKTCPLVLDDIFLHENSEGSGWVEFEKRFTYTTYFLAQVYSHMDEIEKAAYYCRETLRRQKESGDYETLEWVRNCFTLSQLYTQKKLYQESRHLMSCAAHVLLKYELKVQEKLEGNQDTWTEVHQCKASLSRCWIKYAIAVLSDTQNDEDKDVEQFSRLLEDEAVLTIENRIPHHAKSLEDAKSLFIFAQNHVSVAQSYFTLNEHATDFAEITRDHSQLYKHLASLDPDIQRKCKMHKRRSDMLEELLGKLNPTYYLSVCRQLQFELGELCYEMIDLKSGGKCSEELTFQVGAKINILASKGIGHFLNFTSTLKDKSGKLPEVFSDDLARPALIAHFYMAKYFSRIIEGGNNRKLHNFQKMEQNYKYIVRYVERNAQHAACVEKELPVIKEMLELMPEKMLQITGSTVY